MSSQDDLASVSSNSVDTVSSLISLRGRSLQMWGSIRNSIRLSKDENFLLEDTSSFAQHLEREARERARIAREQERRFAQFKKDEAFIMNLMNERLERELKDLERKRLAKEKEAARIKEFAHKRNVERQRKLLNFLIQDKAQEALNYRVGSPSKLGEDSEQTAATLEDSFTSQEEANGTFERNKNNNNSTNSGDSYQKTIRWCPSVDRELERRKIHRATHPTKPGGIAQRVRRLPKTKDETKNDENQEDTKQMVSDYLEAIYGEVDENEEETVRVTSVYLGAMVNQVEC